MLMRLLLATGHTVALAVLWVFRKSRNMMVSDAFQLSKRGIASLISEHAMLWTCHASRKLDTDPITS